MQVFYNLLRRNTLNVTNEWIAVARESNKWGVEVLLEPY